MTAAAGDSGTPLPQTLGLKAGQRVLFSGPVLMIFWALALSLLGGSVVTGTEVRPASEEEIAAALIGCWEREQPAGSDTRLTMCFGPEDQVTTTWTVSRTRASEPTGKSLKTFSVIDGKLRIAGGAEPEWNMESSEQSCDVLMRVDVAMRLENCTLTRDHGSEVISEPFNGSVSYAKTVQE